jgi:SbsC C-terminal domain
MNKKKAFKVATSTAIAAAAFVAANPAQAATSSQAETLVKDAEQLAGALKWAISVEGSATVDYPNMEVFNATKDARDKAQAAVKSLSGTQKYVLQARLDSNVNLHIDRAVAFIDAVTSGKKIEEKAADLEMKLDKGINNDTVSAYHTLTEEIRKQATLLYRVYGKSTRDAILATYKAPAEGLLDEAKYPVSVKMELNRLDSAIDANDKAEAMKRYENIKAWLPMVKDADLKATLSSEFASLETSYRALVDTGVIVDPAPNVPSTEVEVVTVGDEVKYTLTAYNADGTLAKDTAVDIKLVDPSAVTVKSDGTVVFKDTDPADNLADLDLAQADATISKLNGLAHNQKTVDHFSTGESGKVTFTVKSGTAVSAVPVMFVDKYNDDQISLSVDNTPTEGVAIGKTAKWLPKEAKVDSYKMGTVVEVNKAEGWYTLDLNGNGYADVLAKFDNNDRFRYLEVGATVDGGLTRAQFEAHLSVGDQVDFTYNPDTAGVTIHSIQEDKVGAVTNLEAKVSGSDAVVTFDKVGNFNVEGYMVERTVKNSKGAVVSQTKFDRPILQSEAGVFVDKGFGDIDSSLTVTYTVYAVDAEGSTEFYAYGVKATSNAINPPAKADTKAPVLTGNALTDTSSNNTLDGILNQGDVFTLEFDDALSAVASNATLHVTDTDGTVSTITNGKNATFTVNGSKLQVKITGDLENTVTGGVNKLSVPFAITNASGIKDDAGHAWVPGDKDAAHRFLGDADLNTAGYQAAVSSQFKHLIDLSMVDFVDVDNDGKLSKADKVSLTFADANDAIASAKAITLVDAAGNNVVLDTTEAVSDSGNDGVTSVTAAMSNNNRTVTFTIGNDIDVHNSAGNDGWINLAEKVWVTSTEGFMGANSGLVFDVRGDENNEAK